MCVWEVVEICFMGRGEIGTVVLFICFRFNKIDYFPWSSVIF